MLPPEHTSAINAAERYAESLEKTESRGSEALALRLEVWQQRKAALGHAHLDTITAANNYAVSLSGLGRDAEALPIQEEVWQQRKAALGPAHLKTIKAAKWYAHSLRRLGRHAEVRSLGLHP